MPFPQLCFASSRKHVGQRWLDDPWPQKQASASSLLGLLMAGGIGALPRFAKSNSSTSIAAGSGAQGASVINTSKAWEADQAIIHVADKAIIHVLFSIFCMIYQVHTHICICIYIYTLTYIYIHMETYYSR